MIKCTECGREFKSPQSLGGHMRGAHKVETQPGTGLDKPKENAATVEKTETPGGEAALVPEEASKAEQIRNYLKQGFTLKQLTSQFDFSETTIRQEIAKLVRPEGEAIDEKGKQQDNIWPVVRKMGGGMEVISPEAVLRQYMGGGTPEEQLELRAIMKFRAAMLMVMDLVNVQKGNAEADAKRMEPILRLMKETREEQDAAAARAKASSEDIADRAAQATASQLFGAVSQNNAQVAGSLDQIKKMVGGESKDPFTQIVSMMQSMQQMSQMFGMPMPGMPPGGPVAPGSAGAQSQVELPPIEKHSINELEGK